MKGFDKETEKIQEKISNIKMRIRTSHVEKQKREEQKIIEGKQKEIEKKMSNIFVIIGLVLITALIIYIVPFFIPEEKDPWVNQVNGQPIVCRHVACGKTPLNHEWEIRFCSEHIQGTKTCRYPGCLEEISKSSKKRYCYKHN